MESKETGGIILAGIDSLVVGFAVEKFLFSEEERQALADSKVHAGSKVFGGADSAISWYGQDLAIRPGGAKGYEWILHNSDLHVGIASEARGGSVYPEIMATFSSALLWREGPAKAFEMTQDWLKEWAVLGADKVSRADLCADLAMAAPKIDLGSELICRARSRVDHGMIAVAEHKSGRKRTGYEIGRGDLHARFYDKREELKKSDKDWFEVLWRKGGWDGQSPITRFEFQFRRKVLKEFQTETFADLLAQAPDLWKYATEDWCKVCEETLDKNRSRWPLKPFWKTVQEAGALFGTITGVSRVRQKQAKYWSLKQQLAGIMLSMIALEIAGTGNGLMALAHIDAVWRSIRRDDSLLERAKERAAKYACMSV